MPESFSKRFIALARHGYLRIKSYLGRPKAIIQDKPILLSNHSVCSNPIFLIGVHRSGTSLCRRLLNAHSQIACPPETYYLSHFASMIKDPNTFSGFRGLGYNENEATQEIRRWASQYHEAYRIANSKHRWADKTPQYISILHEIDAIFGPSCRYVMIFRHPLDVIYSIWSRGWQLADYDKNPLKNTALYVKEAMNEQLNFAEIYADRCVNLYYENLTKDPQKELSRVLNFLDEKWEDQILNYHEFNHNYGTEDPIVRGTKGIFDGNSGNWKAFNRKQMDLVNPIISDILHKLGYEL